MALVFIGAIYSTLQSVAFIASLIICIPFFSLIISTIYGFYCVYKGFTNKEIDSKFRMYYAIGHLIFLLIIIWLIIDISRMVTA
ncbi:hypothetical protein [Mucilaginibacter ginkgonis]|uniref:Uncharacterized protein n=1 Tax=Mucilaginibacter ginkgonis TaxID=2682091 RepID=A0A6I4HYW9_9SPHI|nr:hypothetical protein [Mucilaginibacter ginkgonis]QQL49784.1 hypothetical protein GO620_016695 [Mucilaginibacter ginkgonis]